MSLRAFHIIFITFATLLTFGTAAWEITTGDHFWVGLLLCLIGVALILYGVWFYQKLKRKEI